MRRERHELIEQLAATWRAIGQPDTSYFVLLVKTLSDASDELEDEELGMPVLAFPSDILGNEVGIAVDRDVPHHADMPFRFADEWRRLSPTRTASQGEE